MIQFADSVGSIQVFNQVVRIELLAAGGASPTQTQGDPQPVMVPVGHLILPIEGLIQTFGALEKIMQQLADAGTIKRISQGSGGVPGMPAAMSGSAGGKKRPA